MAKPPEKVIQKAIEREMPGYTISKRATQRDSRRRTTSDAASPDIETLKKKYLRKPSARTAPGTEGAKTESADSPKPDAETGFEDAIVAVEPVDRSRDGQLPGGSRSKRVVYSGKSDKIVGRQG
jgi:hypothetical protein